MAKASDNDFPSVLLTEQSSKPASPAAGKRRIYFKTDNKLYNVDEGGTETEIGAAGGNLTTTSAYASPPTPASGDVWFPNNSFYLLRYSGAAEVPWGPIYPMTLPPAVSGLTWVNQGGATAVETNGGIALVNPAASGDNVRALVATAPATPWTFTTYIECDFLNVNYHGFGLCFRQSSDGKLHLLSLGSDSGVLHMYVIQYSNATTWNATILDIRPTQVYKWLRISDTGTDRTYSISCDGVNFDQFYTHGRTTYLTADQYGIFSNLGGNTSYGMTATCMSWKVT